MRGAMPALFETSFADALLDADRPIPDGVTAHNAAVPARRFAVYRNNVVVGLGKALRSRFPVVGKIVGEEFFAAMARLFVQQQPPRSPLLATYGDDFPAFIAAFEPARVFLSCRRRGSRPRTLLSRGDATLGAEPFAALDSRDVGEIRRSAPRSESFASSPTSHLGDEQRRVGACAHHDWRGEDALAALSRRKSARCRQWRHSCFARSAAAGEAAEALADDGFRSHRQPRLIGSGLVRIVAPPTEYPQP